MAPLAHTSPLKEAERGDGAKLGGGSSEAASGVDVTGSDRLSVALLPQPQRLLPGRVPAAARVSPPAPARASLSFFLPVA